MLLPQGNPVTGSPDLVDTSQGSCLSTATTGVLTWTAGAAADLGAMLSSTLAGTSGVLALAPTATATQDDDSGQYFYHGTSTFEGGPLDTSIATDQDTMNFQNSNAGFYLATDPDTAVHFAAAAGQK